MMLRFIAGNTSSTTPLSSIILRRLGSQPTFKMEMPDVIVCPCLHVRCNMDSGLLKAEQGIPYLAHSKSATSSPPVDSMLQLLRLLYIVLRHQNGAAHGAPL
ncbi:hypothetical protein NU195Hw_g5014t1 [Hortaea werneckii]